MGEAWTALALTLKVAGWATAINLVLGVGVGYALSRWRFPGRDVLDALLTLPMVMPPTVLGYYLLVVIGSQGVVGAWLLQNLGIRLIFTWQAAVIAATIVAFPLVFKAARAAFENVDPQWEDAARTLGLSEWSIFLRVSLPLAWRGFSWPLPGRWASSAPRSWWRAALPARRRPCPSRCTRPCRRGRTTPRTSW
jgi:molybdate transport system permease protein